MLTATASNSSGSRIRATGCGGTLPSSPDHIRRWSSLRASGIGWADLLEELGVELTLAHAARLKAIAAAKTKTDRLDSDLLAQLLRVDLIPAAHRIAREARGPRDLLRLRPRLVGKRVSCLNSLERIREKYHVSRRDELDSWYRQKAWQPRPARSPFRCE